MLDDRDFSASFELPQPRNVTHQDALGKRRTFAGLDLAEWSFILVSCVNIFIVIGLTLERLIITRNDTESFDFTYSLLLLISALFCLFYVFNGVLRERQYEIYAFIAAVLLVLAYCFFEYIFNVQYRNTIKLLRLIIGSVFVPLNIVLALIVAKKFGWLEFRIVGASEALQQMYRQLCFFFTLQRFDLQAAASFLILVLKNATLLDQEEQVTLGIGVPLLIITFFIGFFAIQKEVKPLVLLFLLLSLIEPIYINYKLYDLYASQTEMRSCLNYVNSACIHIYCVITVGLLAILVRFILFIELFVVYRNFGYGLTERAFAVLVDSEYSSLLGRQRRH